MSNFEPGKFIPPPDPELICGICMNVLDCPVETQCRHVFCRECIEKALAESSKCPLCRSRCSKRQLQEVLPLLQNIINKLTMKCDYYDEGCRQLIVKEYYLEHLKSCLYMKVHCRYQGCNQLLLKKDCEEHETKICVHREQICENGCGQAVSLANRESHSCMQALLALIEDMKGKCSELEKKVEDLNSVITGLTSKLEEYESFQRGDSFHSHDYDESHMMSHSTWSSPDYSYEEFDEYEDFDHSLNIRSPSNSHSRSHSRSESRSCSRSSSRSQSCSLTQNNSPAGNIESSAQSGTLIISDYREPVFGHLPTADNEVSISQIEETSRNNNASGALESTDISFNENNASRTTGNAYGDNLGTSSNEESAEEFLLLNDPNGSNKLSRNMNDHNCGKEVSTQMSSSSSHHANAPTNSKFVLGISGTVVQMRDSNLNSNEAARISRIPEKRQHEDDKEEKNWSSKKKVKLLSVTKNRLNENDEGSSSGSQVCHHKSSAIGTKQPLSSSKKTRSESSSSLESMAELDDTNFRNGQCENIQCHEPNHSIRMGPVTRRSARLQDRSPVLEDSVIADVDVPPTAAYLLSLYEEEDSSDDRSWTPPEQNN